MVHKFIRKFNKMTIQYEKNIVNEKYLGLDVDLVLKQIIPLCQKYGVIEGVETKQSRQASTAAYRMLVDMEELFKYDAPDEKDNPLSRFWKEVNSK